MSPVYIGLLIAGIGLLFELIGVVTRARAGRLAAAPFVKTGEVGRASGAASAQGNVAVRQALGAPCSNTPCVFWRIVVEVTIKEQRGTQTTTKWEKVFEAANATAFAIDDGSGPAWVQTDLQMDADLEQTYCGPPPGGPGLGSLVAFIPNNTVLPQSRPGHEVTEYRVTEKVIRAGGELFVVGAASGGQLVPPPQGKMMVSTRGRDALIGSTRLRATVLQVVGALGLVAGAVVAVLKPGVVPGCGALKDEQVKACAISAAVQTLDLPQPDGTRKPTPIRRAQLAWQVSKAGKFELSAQDPRKRHAAPSIQVENGVGMPMNVDFGLAVGAGAYSTQTTTHTLDPGAYTIYVFYAADGPSDLELEIHAST